VKGLALLAAIGVASCGGGSAAALVEQAGLSMGTELRLSVWTADAGAARHAMADVFAEFDRLDALMSVWREGSDIQRLNAAAGTAAVPVSVEVLEVLRAGRTVSEMSAGAFDVTFGALSGLWRFDHDQDHRIPPPDAIAARLPLIGYQRIGIEGPGVRLPKPGMRVHLGGIGKGYAIDRAAALLRGRGFHDFLIQSGGDIYASGHRGDRPWRVGIRDPRGPADRSFAALDLTDEAISTSGDYERFFVQDGRRYHHILDPRTGQPAAGARSVTIVSDRSMWADALSTAVFVMGPQAGMALIERTPALEGVIVSAGNDVLVSSGLHARLMMRSAPSSDEP
jgi:FAD:protein FMN transferase